MVIGRWPMMNQSTLEDSNYVRFFCKREHGTGSWWPIPPNTWSLSKLGEVSLVVVGMAESSIKGWPFSGVHMRFLGFKTRWTHERQCSMWQPIPHGESCYKDGGINRAVDLGLEGQFMLGLCCYRVLEPKMAIMPPKQT